MSPTDEPWDLTHTVPVPIPVPTNGKNSCAMWAAKPNGTAVVFVHGFGGKSIATWNEFDDMLPSLAGGRGSDIVFFGYDGVFQQATASSNELLELLTDWMNHPTTFVNSTLPSSAHRTTDLTYDKLVVVAHSLGACVARQALLSAHQKGEAWAPKTRLVLFAPAHHGASLIHLAQASLSGIALGAAALSLVKHYTVLQDLEKGSPYLTGLKDAVSDVLDAGAHHLAAKEIAQATNDHVVYQGIFHVSDAPAKTLAPGHMGVCKPDSSFLEPVKLVEAQL